MPQIALLVEPSSSMKLNVIRELRLIVPTSVSALSAALSNSEPVFVEELYGRDNPEFAKQLLTLLDWLECHSVPYSAFQLLDGESFDPAKCNDYYFRVDSKKLDTMLRVRASSLELQERMGRLEEGLDE